MKLLVATDAHIYETPDGRHWTPAIYGYAFWTRYLNVFETVRIVARTKKVDKLPDKVLAVDGKGVEVYPVPFYQGPKQLAKVYFKINKALRNVADGCDAALFRMPSQTAQMTYRHVKGKIPIGGEIVYDPTDDLKRTDVSWVIHLLNRIISSNLKSFCYSANGVSYVTEHSIQRHYPSKARLEGESDQYFESFYSTITLSDDAFYQPRNYDGITSLKIAFSNVSMNSERKGEPVLIRTVAKLRESGCDVSAVLIGDGSMRFSFQALAEKLNIGDYVLFTGRLSSAEEVRKVLMETDMFVFPSQAEGLPRGVLEAMAIGLPVLSTPVGGIPEVIDSKYLFAPQDVDGFANEIVRLMKNTNELNEMSLNNFNRSLAYQSDKLQARRDVFYNKLKALCENKNV